MRLERAEGEDDQERGSELGLELEWFKWQLIENVFNCCNSNKEVIVIVVVTSVGHDYKSM